MSKTAAVLASLLCTLACATSSTPPAPPSPAQISDLEALANAEDATVDDQVALGAAYAAAGDWLRSEQVLNAALQRDSGAAEAEFFLGVTYEALQRWEDAEAAYDRYLQSGGDAGEVAAERRQWAARGAARATVRSAIEDEAALAQQSPPPGTVGVFPFVYVGDDATYAPLGRAMAEFLTTDLSQVDRLTVLERSRVQLMTDELALAQTDLVDGATAARSGLLLGAATVIQGTVGSEGDDLSITAFSAPVAPGTTQPIREVSEGDQASRFFETEKAVALGLFETMGIELTPAERERVLRLPTNNLQAVLAFGTGLEALDLGSFAAARAAFEQAVALDPGFARAQEQLQEAGNLQSASTTAPMQAAQVAAADLPQVGAPIDMFQRIETLLPNGEIRDPTVEVLGIEGLIPTQGILEVLVPRPGGND